MSEGAAGLFTLVQWVCYIGVEKASLGSGLNPRTLVRLTIFGSLTISTSRSVITTQQSSKLYRRFLLLHWLGFPAICHEAGLWFFHTLFRDSILLIAIGPCTDWLNFRWNCWRKFMCLLLLHWGSCFWIFLVLYIYEMRQIQFNSYFGGSNSWDHFGDWMISLYVIWVSRGKRISYTCSCFFHFKFRSFIFVHLNYLQAVFLVYALPFHWLAIIANLKVTPRKWMTMKKMVKMWTVNGFTDLSWERHRLTAWHNTKLFVIFNPIIIPIFI